MEWLKKNEKLIFWFLCIGSLIFGIVGVELDKQWIFMIGFGMTALIIVIGLFFTFYRKYKKQ